MSIIKVEAVYFARTTGEPIRWVVTVGNIPFRSNCMSYKEAVEYAIELLGKHPDYRLNVEGFGDEI